MSLTLAIEHAIKHVFFESPLAPNLDARYLAFLGKPIERPLLDVEVFRGTSDVEYHIHQATSYVRICDADYFVRSVSYVYSATREDSLAPFAYVAEKIKSLHRRIIRF